MPRWGGGKRDCPPRLIFFPDPEPRASSMAETACAAFDQELLASTHPADWRNPRPQGRYNLVVIGGGTAGLVCAAAAAGLGRAWRSSRNIVSAAIA